MKIIFLAVLVFGHYTFAISNNEKKAAPIKESTSLDFSQKFNKATLLKDQLIASGVQSKHHKAFLDLAKKLKIKKAATIEKTTEGYKVTSGNSSSTLILKNKSLSEYELNGYKFRKTATHTPEALYHYIVRILQYKKTKTAQSTWNYLFPTVYAEDFSDGADWLGQRGLTLSMLSFGNEDLIQYASDLADVSVRKPHRLRVTCNENPSVYSLKIVIGDGYENSSEAHHDFIMTRDTKQLSNHFSNDFISTIESARADTRDESVGFRNVVNDWSLVHIANPADSTINYPNQYEKTVKLGGWRKNGITDPNFNEQYYSCHAKSKKCKKIPNKDAEGVHYNIKGQLDYIDSNKVMSLLAECCTDKEKKCAQTVSSDERFGLDVEGINYHGKGSETTK